MKNVEIINHPVVQHKLGFLRDKDTKSDEFRRIVKEISRFLAYEATKDCATVSLDVETPLGTSQVKRINDAPVVVSIMRAGNGMLEGILEALPFAQAGHIGIYRDKFIKNTVEYYFKLPDDCKGKHILLADPLIATGDTAIACIDRLKQYNVGKITFISVLASHEGVKQVHEAHPDVNIISLHLEETLNDNGYLIPGLGDAGDRLFQTRN